MLKKWELAALLGLLLSLALAQFVPFAEAGFVPAGGALCTPLLLAAAGDEDGVAVLGADNVQGGYTLKLALAEHLRTPQRRTMGNRSAKRVDTKAMR